MRYTAWLAFLLVPTSLLAQSATPTNNIVTRMTMVESQYFRGSIFSIDVDNREYWVTAKHILTGAEHPPYGSVTAKSVSLGLLDPSGEGEHWVPENFSVIDTEKDVDIVVLAPITPILANPLPSAAIDPDAGIFIGGDCEFLGFPYGGGWRARMNNGQSFWMPFMKHCTVSGLNNLAGIQSTGQRFLVLDGINNAGFSGGPVVYRTGPDQRIIGVISGYVTEPAEVIASAIKSAPKRTETKTSTAQHKETVNLNSGFIIAYDISYAIDTIHKNPVGPLRTAK